MHVLIVEDNPILADGLTHILQRSNHTVTHESNGIRADRLLATQPFDLVILDLGLPEMDGSEILRRLRRHNTKVPVLVLTARNTVEDRVKELDLGADDYLAKPFEIPELEARVRALLRRGLSAEGALLQLGELSLDAAGQRATRNGIPLDLSSRELGVLKTMMMHAGRVISKEMLNEEMSSLEDDMSINAIEVYVHRLRKKIEGSNVHIRTLRGLGYLMETT